MKQESKFEFFKRSLKEYLNIGTSSNMTRQLNIRDIKSITSRKYLFYAAAGFAASGTIIYSRCLIKLKLNF
jgi:hypothetical protein